MQELFGKLPMGRPEFALAVGPEREVIDEDRAEPVGMFEAAIRRSRPR